MDLSRPFRLGVHRARLVRRRLQQRIHSEAPPLRQAEVGVVERLKVVWRITELASNPPTDGRTDGRRRGGGSGRSPPIGAKMFSNQTNVRFCQFLCVAVGEPKAFG